MDKLERQAYSGLGWAFLAFMFIPTVLGLQTYTDDFEDDTPPAAPTDDFYTFSTVGGGQARTSTSVAIDDISFFVDASSAAGTVDTTFSFEPVGVDFCNGGSVKFSLFIDVLPAGGGQLKFGWPGSEASARVDGAGLLTARIVNTISGTIATLATDVWYNITVGYSHSTDCATVASATASVFVDEFDVGGSASVAVGEAPLTTFEFDAAGAANAAKFYVDNFQLIGVNNPPGETALISIAVTDLVGFGVDNTATNLIVRSGGTCTGGGGVTGNCIRIFDPASLAQSADRDTNCIDGDMVAATDIGVVYVYCNAGDGDREIFSIRGHEDEVLFDPAFDPPFDCDPSDECLDDIDFEADCSFDDENFLKEVSDMKTFPISYSNTEGLENPLLGDQARAFVVAYSTTEGYVGVFQYTTRDGNDGCNEERRQFAGAGNVRQISVWQPNPDADDVYIAAVGFGVPTNIYAYSPGVTGAETTSEIDGTMTTGTSLGVLSGTSISCQLQYCLVSYESGTEDRVRLVDIANGASVWPAPGYLVVDGAQVRGVSLSQPTDGGDLNDLIAAYTDAVNVNLVYAANGTEIGRLALPTSGFYDFELSTGGVHCWAGFDTLIAYWPCGELFEGIEQVCLSGPSCDPLDTGDGASPTGGPFGAVAQGAVTAGTFASLEAANFFMGFLMIVGTTVVLGGAPNAFGDRSGGIRFSVVLAVIGAVLGFGLAWLAFGLISNGAAFSIIILVLAGLGVKFWFGRNSMG